MPKRVLALLLIAASILAIAYWWPFVEKSATAEKAPDKQSRAERTTGDDLEWQAELRQRSDRESMESVREKLLAMSAADAVVEIEAFLESGEDMDTGMPFEIGQDGKLVGSPTLRVFLMDLLLEIDPAAAARIGRDILASTTTADEWAVSLRNVARGEEDSANNEYLRKKTEELIRNPEWQATPSVGYLNAFDVLVYTGATESSDLLSGLIRNKDRPDLAHAGFLTLDRLVQQEPVEMLRKIQTDLELQKSRPEMTAQQFARADLRDDTQRELVKTWMLDPTRSVTELRNFAGSYPNNNQMISKNLLTSESQVSGEDLSGHDREVLGLIRAWRSDPEFQSLAPYLETMDYRLTQFVNGADTQDNR